MHGATDMTKMRGARELHMKLGRIGRAAVAEARVALMRGAHRVQNRAVQGIIDPPKTGETYPSRGRKGAPHKASAPGEFPAADTGELHGSITTVENSSRAVTRFEVGANVEYAKHLELGTSKIKPRPFLGPSLAENEAQIRADIQTAVKRGLRKGTR